MNFKYVLGVWKFAKIKIFVKKERFFINVLIVFKEFLDAYESCASALRAMKLDEF